MYFRVRALNRFGSSAFSNISLGYSAHQLAEGLGPRSGLVTVSTICVSVLGFLILVMVTLYFIHRNRNFPQKVIGK